MDAVGDIIAEREHEPFPWAAGASLAFLLHAGIVAAVLVSTLSHPVKFVATRTLAVRLQSAGALKGRTVEIAAPPAPAPEEAAKPRILKPPDEVPPPPTEKAKLLPAKEDPKKPNPPLPAYSDPKGRAKTSTAAPRETSGSEGPTASSSAAGTGTAAEGSGTGVGGLKFDQPGFNYPYYYERVKIAIETNWFKPATSIPTSPVVHFVIQKDGTITDPVLVTSSGLTYVDRAALRAVMAASPLPPLPSDFSSSQIGLSVLFE
jgi:TonB family protein